MTGANRLTMPSPCVVSHTPGVTMSRLGILLTSTVFALTPLAAIAAPNVITDWDEKAAATIQGNVPAAPRVGPSGATRIMAVMHVAMFEAVNAIEGKYAPYKGEA